MKLEHAVHIERLPDADGGGYLATVPALPGCMSDGETPEEALAHIQQAIASWKEAAQAFGTTAEAAPDQPPPEFASMSAAEKAATLLDRMPEELRESAVNYLLEQVDKYRWLKNEIKKGIDDMEAGRVREWDPERYLRDIRSARR